MDENSGAADNYSLPKPPSKNVDFDSFDDGFEFPTFAPPPSASQSNSNDLDGDNNEGVGMDEDDLENLLFELAEVVGLANPNPDPTTKNTFYSTLVKITDARKNLIRHWGADWKERVEDYLDELPDFSYSSESNRMKCARVFWENHSLVPDGGEEEAEIFADEAREKLADKAKPKKKAKQKKKKELTASERSRMKLGLQPEKLAPTARPADEGRADITASSISNLKSQPKKRTTEVSERSGGGGGLWKTSIESHYIQTNTHKFIIILFLHSIRSTQYARRRTLLPSRSKRIRSAWTAGWALRTDWRRVWGVGTTG